MSRRSVSALVVAGVAVLAVLAVVGVLVFNALKSRFELAFVPDGAVYVRYEATAAGGEPLPESRLRAVADAMEFRLVTLGADTAKSGVVGDGFVLAVSPDQRRLLAKLGTTVPAAQFRPVLEVVPTACGAQPPAQEVVCALEDGGPGYRLAAPALSANDVESAEAMQAANGYVIRVTLTEQGSDAFLQLSKRLSGAEPPRDRLAIVIASAVISAPTIIEPISAGEIQISGEFTQDEARRLAGALLARPDGVILRRGELMTR